MCSLYQWYCGCMAWWGTDLKVRMFWKMDSAWPKVAFRRRRRRPRRWKWRVVVAAAERGEVGREESSRSWPVMYTASMEM